MKTTPLGIVAETSVQLQQLRERLAQLDEERVEIRRQIDRCMATLEGEIGHHFGVIRQGTTRELVLSVFRRDPSQRMTVADLAPLVDEPAHKTLSMLLRRMTKDGLLVRIRHGLYALRQ